jgi:hypothetical protein
MTKSWRKVLPIHPAAELLPRMAHDELRALGEDIRENGLRVPLALSLIGCSRPMELAFAVRAAVVIACSQSTLKPTGDPDFMPSQTFR